MTGTISVSRRAAPLRITLTNISGRCCGNPMGLEQRRADSVERPVRWMAFRLRTPFNRIKMI